MATLERMAKMIGGGSRDEREVISATEVALDDQGMVGTPFSPGSPLRPFDGYSTTPRSRDFPTGVNIAARPRLNEQVAFSTLRGLIDAYDMAQIAIWHRIDSIRSLDYRIKPKKGYVGDATGAIDLAEQWISRPDYRTNFKPWLGKFLYDVLAFDAGSLYKMRNNAGRAIGLKVVDGTTIAPLLDDHGDRPTGDAPAYTQFAQGVPWVWLADDDMIYQPFRPVSNSSYGKAPLETILLNANTDLRFQQYFLQRFTDGNVPEGFAAAPENWTPNQIEEFQETWDALLYGDQEKKHQLRWVPHGTTLSWSNEKDFNDSMSLFLMRKTAAAYHVTPADLGFTEDVNRASGETQADVQFRIGDRPLMQHCNDLLTEFIQRDLRLPVEFEFEDGEETKDRVDVANADKIYIDQGVVSVSEVRERRFGLDEPENAPVPRFIMTTRAGPVPLSALMAVAGPVDPEDAAPVPGGPLPHKPFAPIEGVAPQKPPDQPPLAVLAYPEDNQASVQAEQAADNAAVLKALVDLLKNGVGAGVSVASGTVAPASPLVADDDEDETEDIEKSTTTTGINTLTIQGGSPLLARGKVVFQPFGEKKGAETKDKHDWSVENAAAKHASLVVKESKEFSTFVNNSIRKGRWRDFDFHWTDFRTAQEKNRAGRVQVRKAAGEVTVAGLAVLALDTGRVLMLQRALDESDPAGGTWEFPGGHMEPGELPIEAAIREFCEETGCGIPDGTLVGNWKATNGIYQGFVIEVKTEAEIPINPEGYADPGEDGDVSETTAWWSPEQLPGNTALRPELAGDLPLVFDALGVDYGIADGLIEKSGSLWAGHPFRKIDDALVDHHAPNIQEGLKGLVTKAQILAAVEGFLAQQK